MRKLARSMLHHFKDKRAFGRLETIPCDGSVLAPLADIDIATAFRSSSESAWAAAERDISAFQITTGAGGVNPGDRRAVYELVKYLQPRSILEAGTHVGASTVHIARALKDLWSESGSEHDPYRLETVDIIDVNDSHAKPWAHFGSTYAPQEMISRLGCEANVRFFARNALEYLDECSEKYDFIFLDDDHDAAHVYQEIPRALNCLKPRGYILLHDYFPDGKPLWSNKKVIHGPYWAVRRLQDEGAPFKIYPLGKLPWPTKLNSHVTSLALLGHA